MNRDCLRAEELARIPEMPADDPRRQHLAECPRCRALLASYRRFMSAEAPGVDADGEARLDAALDAEIFDGDPGGRASDVGLSGRLRDFFTPPLLRPGLALAAVLLIAFGFWQLRATDPDPRPLLRQSDERPGLTLSRPRRDADGSIRLSWTAHPEADAYRVEIYDAALDCVARFEAGAAATLTLHAPQIAALGEGPFAYRVTALADGDAIEHSNPRPLTSD